jgi:hypothetical protein
MNKSNCCGIYALIDPSDKYIGYIGKSKNIQERYSQHLKSKGSDKKSEWVSSIIESGNTPELEIIEECDEEYLDEREKYWIEFHSENNDIQNEVYNKKSSSKLPRRKLGAHMSGEIGSVLDALQFIDSCNVGELVEKMVWVYIKNKHTNKIELLHLMLEKRDVDFKKEFEKSLTNPT